MKQKRLLQIEKFNQLELRMRIMLTLAVTLLLSLALDSIWLTPKFNAIKEQQQQLQDLDQKILSATEAEASLFHSLNNLNQDPKKLQLVSLKASIASTRLQLEERALNLVNPEDMAAVLREIIHRRGKLKLLSLSKKPVQLLFESQVEEDPLKVYRHPIEIQFSGNFQDTRLFIQALEQMPKKVAFDDFTFSVDTYPRSHIRLVVSTLSFDRKWIGG